jgi:L-ascorbate metabolism protein UlaG (beta-lactamase superfamily)
MDMARAAYAARRFFNFKCVLPSHYRTFGKLAQNADELRAGLPGVAVLVPEVMETVTID